MFVIPDHITMFAAGRFAEQVLAIRTKCPYIYCDDGKWRLSGQSRKTEDMT